MRRMSAALVALTAAIALSALSAPAWAAKPASKSLVVSPTKTRAGQTVKVFGGGCKGITILIFLIDGKEFHRGHTKSGDWTYQIKLPADLRSGDHEMRAECKGSSHKPAKFHVSKGKKDDHKGKGRKHKRSRASFDVSPDVVTAGDKVWAEGAGCKKFAPVTIWFDGHVAKRTYADRHGTFDKGVRVPRHAKKGRHVFSAKCGGRFLGSDGIKVKKTYKQDHDGMYTWGSVVKPGKKVRVRGDDCPDGRPYAKMDGAPLALNVVSKGKGFTGEATIPSGTAPGKHKFYAGCDALETADVSIGSRYVPGGRTVGWSPVRKAISKLGNAYVRLVIGLPVHDATAGYRAFRSDVLRALAVESSESNGYCFQIEMAHRAGRRASGSSRCRSPSPSGSPGPPRCTAGSWLRRWSG
jgi:hypothetical protein